nr:MarR family transcriptional regulator [Feifania hominis]
MEQDFELLYLKFRANYYKRMVEKIGPREGSLSATECFCVEIIHLLGGPTVSQFARYLKISVPNALYKINCLVEKGYVERIDGNDRRENRLLVTAKFLDYYGLRDRDNARLMSRIHESFSEEEIERLDEMIRRIIALMDEPEQSGGENT